MLLIILWFSTIFNTCNKKKEAKDGIENVTTDQDTSDVFQDLDDGFFEDDQDLFTEDSDNQGNSDSGSSAQSNSTNTGTDYFEGDNAEEYTDYTGEPTQSTSKVQSETSDDNSNYLVVAGSFLVKDNATRMMQKLQGMGYTAEVRNFNFSQYHSVIAGRYYSKSDADYVASQLKSQGISCYVHKRQP
jgi:hypothetical protein